MDQNKIKFYIILATEILIVVLASVGIVEREAVLIMTGLLIFYFIFSRIEDSLILFIVSIPLFVALPITGYDSMANWRILLTVLFVVWLFQRNWLKIIFRFIFNKVFRRQSLISPLAKFTSLFLIVAVLSLIVATDRFVGIKKILFLVNIFLLFIVVRDITRDKKMKLKILKAGAAAGIISLIVGYSQLIFVLIKPLYTFWQWWAKNVISVFYGNNLSELLAKSNTWFSYYPDSPPTLRMFSVFPDSHSFALFVIISLVFLTSLIESQKLNLRNAQSPGERLRSVLGSLFRLRRNPYPLACGGSQIKFLLLWIVVILSFLALVFSGSRGIWVSAVIPFLGIIVLAFFKKINSRLVRLFISFLLVFLIAFPVSSWIMSQSYNGGDDNASLAFKRAKTTFDTEELSVKSRMGIWKASFQSILERPLLGVGIGNYPVVLDEDISAAKRGASAHNLYLDVASEMGLLGLIVLLLIFWQIFRKSIHFNQFNHLNHFNLVFTFFLLWIFVYSLFDVVLLNDKVLLLFMVALALLYGKE